MDNYDYSNINKYLQYINRLINCIANWFLKTLCCFAICICFNMIVNNHQIFIPIGHISLLLIIIYLLLIMIFNKNFEEIFLEYCFILFGIILGLMYLNNEFTLISEKITSGFTLIDLKEKIRFLLFHNHDSYFTSCLIIATILMTMSYVFRLLRVLVRFIIRINTDKNNYDVTSNNTNGINRLFKEREKYIILLNKYLQNDYVYGIGLVGEYGSGKSFIIDEFEKRNKFKYIFVRINSFLSNDKSVEEYILKQLKSILYENGIFSLSIDELVDYYDKIKIFTIFNCDLTTVERFRRIKKEVEKINIPIVFVIDDLDRIQSIDRICRIFNVFEMLRSTFIKCIYLYDIEILVEKFKNGMTEIKNVSTDEKLGKYTKYYNYVRKYIDEEIFLVGVDDYLNAFKLLCKENKIIAHIIFDKRNSINNRIKNLRVFNNSFDYYCYFNPRIINAMLTEYEILNKKYDANIDKENTLLICCLLFKYYFEKMYYDYKLSRLDIYNYLNKHYERDVLYDAITLCFYNKPDYGVNLSNDEKIFLRLQKEEEIKNILKKYDNNDGSSNDKISNKLNKAIFILLLLCFKKNNFRRAKIGDSICYGYKNSNNIERILKLID